MGSKKTKSEPITESKQSQELFRQKEPDFSFYAEILGSMAEGVSFIRASDGKIVNVNSGFENMF